MTSRTTNTVCRALCALSLAFSAAPAWAGDDTEEGLLVGLGLSAAAGKTTLGEGAGSIEAGLLGGEAFQQAGAIVASVVNSRRAGRPVLLLSASQSVDLLSSELIKQRMTWLAGYVAAQCKIPKPAKPSVRGGDKLFEYSLSDGAVSETEAATDEASEGGMKLKLADVAGALLIDSSISAITLAADDRMMINSVLMNARRPAWEGTAGDSGWTLWPPRDRAIRDSLGVPPSTYPPLEYWAPGESVGIPGRTDPEGSAMIKSYQALVDKADEERPRCASDEGKAALKVADDYITSLHAADKGPSPLAAAVQMDHFRAKNPLVLRLAVEQVGGTAISRSGLIYAFGWPGASTVSSGLLVSFRLVDPDGGALHTVGMVRCMVRQTNIKAIGNILEGRSKKYPHERHKPGETVCDFRFAA